MKRQFNWLIIYDIRDEKRLRKIARLMQNYGLRVQKSVFEAQFDISTLKKMRSEADRILNFEKYSLVIFEICQRDWQKAQKYGSNVISIGESSLFKIL